MENNEIMINEENEVMNDEFVAEGNSGIGAGVAMLIGAGLTLAVGAGVKLAKKGIAYIKTKKELRKPDKEIIVEAEQVEEVVEPEE
jgi:hypothetical protein